MVTTKRSLTGRYETVEKLHELFAVRFLTVLFLCIFTRWSEQLAVYLQTNKQNQKKKRKVDPVATQVA